MLAVYANAQPRLDKTVKAQVVAFERFQERPTRRNVRAVIRADKRINTALADIQSAVAAQVASSTAGEAARGFALTELRSWQRAIRVEIRSAKAGLADQDERSRRLFERAQRIFRQETVPAGRKAVRRFKAAGFSSSDGAASDVQSAHVALGEGQR